MNRLINEFIPCHWRRSNISKTTRSVSSKIQTPRSLTSRCLDIGWNTEWSFWYGFYKWTIILREISWAERVISLLWSRCLQIKVILLLNYFNFFQPQRHKLPKNQFVPSALKNISLTGVFGQKVLSAFQWPTTYSNYAWNMRCSVYVLCRKKCV